MTNNIYEMGSTVKEESENDKLYQEYLKLGGIINKEDWKSALTRTENKKDRDQNRISQIEAIARFAGIDLVDTEDELDKRIVLYELLRSDVQPEKVQYHHQQMTNQRIFAEVLKMVGDTDSLNKFVKRYPHIDIGYRPEEEEEHRKAA
ncbi:MAG: hypothetical protein Q8L47_02740 [bacterium]|nr:hypothetical protein [bacterium]